MASSFGGFSSLPLPLVPAGYSCKNLTFAAFRTGFANDKERTFRDNTDEGTLREVFQKWNLSGARY